MKNNSKENNQLIDIDFDFDFEIPQFSGSISVLRELEIEIGCEIYTVWVDGRLHLPGQYNPILVEASIINPQGEESKVLDMTYQEVQNNASNGKPYFKSANPLGTGSGEYKVKVYGKALCLNINVLGGSHFVCTVTPKIRMYVDGDRDPVVDVSYPPICRPKELVLTETTQEWPILYGE